MGLGPFHWYDWLLLLFALLVIIGKVVESGKSKNYAQVRYVGGHPEIEPYEVFKDWKIKVFRSTTPGHLVMKQKLIPVKKVEWIPKEKWVQTKEIRGRSGLTGALIGGALGGPAGMVAGAVIGKRQAQVLGEMKDDSYTIIHSQYGDAPIQLYFQCNNAEHNRLLKLIYPEPKPEKQKLHLASKQKNK